MYIQGAPPVKKIRNSFLCDFSIFFKQFSFNHRRSATLDMHQNHFRPGLCPRPRWESLRRSPRPSSRLGRGMPLTLFPPPRCLRPHNLGVLKRFASYPPPIHISGYSTSLYVPPVKKMLATSPVQFVLLNFCGSSSACFSVRTPATRRQRGNKEASKVARVLR